MKKTFQSLNLYKNILFNKTSWLQNQHHFYNICLYVYNNIYILKLTCIKK